MKSKFNFSVNKYSNLLVDDLIKHKEKLNLEISQGPLNCNIIDAEQCILTPGFIDSHTHPILIGNRSNDFLMRLNGSSYEVIKIYCC